MLPALIIDSCLFEIRGCKIRTVHFELAEIGTTADNRGLSPVVFTRYLASILCSDFGFKNMQNVNRCFISARGVGTVVVALHVGSPDGKKEISESRVFEFDCRNRFDTGLL